MVMADTETRNAKLQNNKLRPKDQHLTTLQTGCRFFALRWLAYLILYCLCLVEYISHWLYGLFISNSVFFDLHHDSASFNQQPHHRKESMEFLFCSVCFVLCFFPDYSIFFVPSNQTPTREIVVGHRGTWLPSRFSTCWWQLPVGWSSLVASMHNYWAILSTLQWAIATGFWF